ncbi:hypothetical protein BJX65DRAFT_242855 [Aspergillus insuetus]
MGAGIMDFLCSEFKDQFNITQKALQTAVKFTNCGILCQIHEDYDPQIEASEETLVFASRYFTPRTLYSLLERSKKQLTRAIVEAAAQSVKGIATLEWLLDHGFNETFITPDVVAAAAGRARDVDRVIDLLVATYPDRMVALFNEQALLAAAYSGRMDVLDMFAERFSLSPTEEHRAIAKLRQASLTNDLETLRDVL